jgi:hypothetical protein
MDEDGLDEGGEGRRKSVDGKGSIGVAVMLDIVAGMARVGATGGDTLFSRANRVSEPRAGSMDS